MSLQCGPAGLAPWAGPGTLTSARREARHDLAREALDRDQNLPPVANGFHVQHEALGAEPGADILKALVDAIRRPDERLLRDKLGEMLARQRPAVGANVPVGGLRHVRPVAVAQRLLELFGERGARRRFVGGHDGDQRMDMLDRRAGLFGVEAPDLEPRLQRRAPVV